MKEFILLTGGTGFIGSQLAENLLNQGENLVLLKRSYSDTWRINHFKNLFSNFEMVNIDESSIQNVFLNYNIKAVLHLATYYTKFHSSNDIYNMINSNITFPTELLENAVKNNTKYFINTGSFTEYSLKNIPLNENTEISPFNLYSSTKVAFEDILKFYHHEYGLKSSTLKLFTPYGPKDDENKIIPYLIINSILKNKIQINSASRKLDVIYVNDIIEAYKCTMNNIKNFKNYENFNIGNGISYSIKEIYSLIESKIGKIDIEFFDSDSSQVKANIQKAHDLINWKPKISLEKGLKLTIDYYKKIFNKNY